ncbi:probable serine/threonine-protein kinase At1g54610 [Vigna umbellata]|uniref:probable serine/threonine-protein kinase At1g54610 n=1 Tax=Vigna umbellata TaxID=87088 RepID=UPI001F5EA244|nr:probable serine/threonine-protein kinase At1g54610 [Vigna umbellata]
MGCICSKAKSSSSHQYVSQNHTEGLKATPSPNTNTFGDTTSLISNVNQYSYSSSNATQEKASTPIFSDQIQQKGDKKANGNGVRSTTQTQLQQPKMSRLYSITRGERGVQVLAGWPSWLSAVAGEAISGWIPRRADSFEKLDKAIPIVIHCFLFPSLFNVTYQTNLPVMLQIGQGTYSSVYKARDLETNKIVALKKVRFTNMDPESVRFMSREVIVLRRLDHPNVMKLEGMIASRVSGSLYLIFEYMEHDLAGLAAIPDIKFSEAQIKCYMQQLLRGLEHCHSRGVMHRDIKGSNLLIDSNGRLKIADFGLATLLQSSQGLPLTSRVVTLWYRPPELLLGATDYGTTVDLWSAGCILAELFVGKPILSGRTEVEQLHKIFKLCGSPSEEYWKKSKLPHATIFKPQHPYIRVVSQTFKDFPSSTLSLLEVLLAVESDDRGTASSALRHEFFTTMPLPCDPSSLPKYPPSKEFDAKLRQEEAKRRRAPNKGHEYESLGNNFRESTAVPVPGTNAEFQATTGKPGLCNVKHVSEKYNYEKDDGYGFSREPVKATSTTHNVFSHSGQSMHPSVYGSSRTRNLKEENVLICPDHAFISRKSELSKHTSYWQGSAAKLSRFSNSIAARGDSLLEMSGGDFSVNSQLPEDQFGTRYSHKADGESNQLLDGLKS